MSYIVAQLGARMHYAVPRVLYGAGRLEHLFTDICASNGWPRLCRLVPRGLQSDGLRRVASRMPAGIPRQRVTGFNIFGVRYAQRRRIASTPNELTRVSLWAGRTICRSIVRRGLGGARGVYAFNSAGLELLEAAKATGRHTILEQTIAPHRIERALLQAEREKFPDWEGPPESDDLAEMVSNREEQEWRLADLILCGSSFVQQGIARCGGPAHRSLVVPYGVDRSFGVPPRQDHGGPLRVLFVGAVGLRKGAPYVLAAARALRGRVTMRMVGCIHVSARTAGLLSEAVELTGPVPRSAMPSHFAWAEVFLLPSLCEGSATVVYEALAAELPVICTPNTGSVVRDGMDGVIVPAGDADAVTSALARLADSHEMRRVMAQNARQRADGFDLTAYGDRLIDAMGFTAPGDPA